MTNLSWPTPDQIEELKRLLKAAEEAEMLARKAVQSRELREEVLQCWSESLRRYELAEDYVTKGICRAPDCMGHTLPEHVKDEYVLKALVKRCYCELQITRYPQTELHQYDSASQVSLAINELERKLAVFRIKNQTKLWNILQYEYDLWGEERRSQGMKSEADELQYLMLRARTRYQRFQALPDLSRSIERLVHFKNNLVDQFLENSLASKLNEKWRRLGERLTSLVDFGRVWVETCLYRIGKGIFLPFVVFMVLPILVCAVIYHRAGCILLESPDASQPDPMSGKILSQILVEPAQHLAQETTFVESLEYSVFVFTGSEPGPLTACREFPHIRFTMAAEAVMSYIFTVFVIGYLVNRLSSR